MTSPAKLLVASSTLAPRSRAAALVRLLERDFQAILIAADAPESLLALASAALEKRPCDAAVLIDGTAARAVLPAIQQGWTLPAVLACFPPELPGAASSRRLACAPEAAWLFGDRPWALRTDGLLPRRVHERRPAPDRAWVAGRLRELLDRRTPGLARPRELTSIIIPCWNNLRYTKACLRGVRRCTSTPYELILVDNGSSDGTASFFRRLRKTGQARVIRNETNLGFGAAINQGMRQAKGDYLVWLNNDAIVTPGWLDRLIACARRAPWVGAVGPVVNEFHEFLAGEKRAPWAAAVGPARAPKTAAAANADAQAAAFALSKAGQAAPVHWLVGYCLLLKRRAVEEVGLIDPRFGRGYYEDYDYCLRLRQAGYEIFLAKDAYVFHHWRGSFGRGASRNKTVIASRDAFVDKWCRFSLDFLCRLPDRQAWIS